MYCSVYAESVGSQARSGHRQMYRSVYAESVGVRGQVRSGQVTARCTALCTQSLWCERSGQVMTPAQRFKIEGNSGETTDNHGKGRNRNELVRQ